MDIDDSWEDETGLVRSRARHFVNKGEHDPASLRWRRATVPACLYSTTRWVDPPSRRRPRE